VYIAIKSSVINLIYNQKHHLTIRGIIYGHIFIKFALASIKNFLFNY
jgi:hypothetical protein